MFDAHLSKALAMVDESTKTLIGDALINDIAKQTVKMMIKKGLDEEPDVLLDLETKFARCFKVALADAVANLVAWRKKPSVLNQLLKL